MVWAERAGSLRRGQDLVNDLVFVIATDSPTAVLDALEASAQVGRVLHRETDRIDLTLEGAEVASVRGLGEDSAKAGSKTRCTSRVTLEKLDTTSPAGHCRVK